MKEMLVPKHTMVKIILDWVTLVDGKYVSTMQPKLTQFNPISSILCVAPCSEKKAMDEGTWSCGAL